MDFQQKNRSFEKFMCMSFFTLPKNTGRNEIELNFQNTSKERQPPDGVARHEKRSLSFLQGQKKGPQISFTRAK